MRISVITALLLAGAPAAAQRLDCTSAADQATMNQCADQAFRRSDASLNALYRQLQQRLSRDPERAKLLTAAQRAWVGFRDAECRFSSSGVEGGSVYPLIDLQCAEGLTRGRIGDLKAYLACKEGDLSCPVPPG